MMEDPTKKDVLYLILTNKEVLVGDVKVEGSLAYSEHKLMEIRILWGGRRAMSKIGALHFRRAILGLLRDLLGKIPWENAIVVKKGPSELVNIQRSLPSGSRTVNPYGREIEQKGQEICMDEQGTPVKSQA
ncbi:dtw domain-containing protein 2 [Willisornis vidua]|uniref:Dtw domain-containing protein 2 n=1 Tax=Willisornis vidua TaxID=1566151 RepID=A0ABQ9D997_9PASS|nr:dtw domain-containing protein 2 [Willisornis vidua]